MNIKIEFAHNKSLGNIYENKMPNNFESFDSVEKFYELHKFDLDNSITEIINKMPYQAFGNFYVSIPLIYFQDTVFKSLNFFVIARTKEEIVLALTNVEH